MKTTAKGHLTLLSDLPSNSQPNQKPEGKGARRCCPHRAKGVGGQRDEQGSGENRSLSPLTRGVLSSSSPSSVPEGAGPALPEGVPPSVHPVEALLDGQRQGRLQLGGEVFAPSSRYFAGKYFLPHFYFSSRVPSWHFP